MEINEQVPAGEATTPTQAVPTADNSASAALTEPETTGLQEAVPTLTVKFNKQEYQLPLDQAAAYAQQGMKLESVQPMLDRLKTLAQSKGRSLAAFVDELCGDTPADLNERLAQEFHRLRQECPEVDTFDRVPRAAVQEAIDTGTPLLWTYLRYCHGEQTRIRQAQQTAAAAAAASAGTQRGQPSPAPDPAVEAMVRGVWG